MLNAECHTIGVTRVKSEYFSSVDDLLLHRIEGAAAALGKPLSNHCDGQTRDRLSIDVYFKCFYQR